MGFVKLLNNFRRVFQVGDWLPCPFRLVISFPMHQVLELFFINTWVNNGIYFGEWHDKEHSPCLLAFGENSFTKHIMGDLFKYSLFSLLKINHGMGDETSMMCTSTSTDAGRSQLISLCIGLVHCLVIAAVWPLMPPLVHLYPQHVSSAYIPQTYWLSQQGNPYMLLMLPYILFHPWAKSLLWHS